MKACLQLVLAFMQFYLLKLERLPKLGCVVEQARSLPSRHIRNFL